MTLSTVTSNDIDDYFKEGRFLRRWTMVSGRPRCLFDAYEASRTLTFLLDQQVCENARVRRTCAAVEAFEEKILAACGKWIAPDQIDSIRKYAIPGGTIPDNILSICKNADHDVVSAYRERRVHDPDTINEMDYYYDIDENSGTLCHFTHSLDALVSILKNGLVYVPQIRKILASLIGDVVASKEFRCRGMVCFFEGDIKEATRQRYGKYGIALNRGWAKKRGAEKVIYMDESGPVFQTYRSILKSLLPEALASAAFAEENAAILRDVRTLYQLGATDEFIRAMSLYDYVQHVEDYADREWRIMAPLDGYSIEAENSPTAKIVKDRLNHINFGGISEGSKAFFRLQVEPPAVTGLVLPFEEHTELAERLQTTVFRDVLKIPYPE